jgi:hypothetical protein
MSQVILRFQSLVLHEDGDASTIHFEIEDDDAITRSKASILQKPSGQILVGAPHRYAAIDQDAFADVVRRIHDDQTRLLASLGATPLASCIVALDDGAIVIPERSTAVGW